MVATAKPASPELALTKLVKLLTALVRRRFHGRLEISFQAGHPGIFHVHQSHRLEDLSGEGEILQTVGAVEDLTS